MKRRALLKGSIFATATSSVTHEAGPAEASKEAPGLRIGTKGAEILATEDEEAFLTSTAFAAWDSGTYQTLKERARYVAYSQDFSIDERGSHSSTSGMRKLLLEAANSGARVELGPGTIVVDDTLRTVPVTISGQGITSTTVMAADMEGKDLISFDPTLKLGQFGGISNITIIASGGNLKRAIVTPRDRSQYDIYHSRYLFSNIYCRGHNRKTETHSFGYDYSAGWWMDLGDSNGVDIHNIFIHGSHDISKDPQYQFEDGGIQIGASGALLTARMRNIEIGPIHTAISVQENAFFSLFNFDLISCHHGLLHTGRTAFNEPKIGFGNINAQSIGLDVLGSAREIQSVTIRRHRSGWKGSTQPWRGIRATNSSSLRISGCIMQPDESDGPFLGEKIGVAIKGGGGLIVESNIFGLNLDVAIRLDDVAGAHVNNNVLAGLQGTYLDLCNNSRRIHGDEPAISAGSAKYEMITSDTSIKWDTIRLDDLIGIVKRPHFETVEANDGKIHVSRSYICVKTEGKQVDIDSIETAPWIVDGTECTIQPLEDGDRVLLIGGTGNLMLPHEILLDGPGQFATLSKRGSALNLVSTSYVR